MCPYLDEDTCAERLANLRALVDDGTVTRLFYAIKANYNPRLLERFVFEVCGTGVCHLHLSGSWRLE